jgi:uncharacterized membrane protein YgdD (TMEM256/DUF423 family)
VHLALEERSPERARGVAFLKGQSLKMRREVIAAFTEQNGVRIGEKASWALDRHKTSVQHSPSGSVHRSSIGEAIIIGEYRDIPGGNAADALYRHATMRAGHIPCVLTEEEPAEMKKPAVLFMMIGSVCAFLSVAAGAFGAHALKTVLDPGRLAVYETAAKYQMYHALALVVLGWHMHQTIDAGLTRAGWLFCFGIVPMLDVRWAGAVTPVGGLAFLGGWATLAWTGWRRL